MDMPLDPAARPVRIGILPIADFAVMSYAATVEPLRAANLLAGRMLYEMVHVGNGPVASSGAAVVPPDAQVGAALRLDMLFVIAGGDVGAHDDPALARWLARMAREGVHLGGVSGGPVILARAGLMAGRRMTLHWEYAEALAEASPDLALERSLYVIDRDRMTCAGGTAPLDMMHALIARQHGAAFARRVSDWFMHTEVRPAIGPQRAGLAERVGSHTPAILDAVEVMESHLADPLDLGQIASIAGVSPRQLNRLFTDQLGTPVMRYYRALRLDRAQSLLRNSAMPLTQIALATGFANSSHFSRAYAAQFGHPPSHYRDA
ncbi:GlxA family transcriptional regulator [Roseovarius nanhaiticus]|uniref:GlxA family transcriptional regulator n=1 Tax=Roseovarius nanhaiticus TaxID=573024 RepID=UPI0024912588|nr:GlxA family transcriptional regulator [Roseovarius nanhaiticus]